MPSIKSKLIIAGFIALIAAGVFFGCAKKTAPVTDKIIAAVNGENIYAKDLKRELASLVRQNPSLKITPETLNEIMDLMVNKKIILQEAMANKLTEKQRFIDTIQTFWEQTLIRDFIDQKNSQNNTNIFVADTEVEELYKRLSTKVTLDIVQRPKEEEISVFVDDFKKGNPVTWDQTITLTYQEVQNDMVAKAFELDAGATQVFATPGMFVFVHMVSKEPVTIPPMDEISSKLKETIKQQKQQRAFGEWLTDKKKGSKIVINADVALQEAKQ